jgi:hypothetical protein
MKGKNVGGRTSKREDEVRAAFAEQARWSRKFESPFTARLCDLLGKSLTPESPLGTEILSWPGNPFAKGDALPLRLAGAFHGLARTGRHPALAALYPPNPLPEEEVLWAVLRQVMADDAEEIGTWLAFTPQTNEVARSAALMAGLVVLSAEYGLPFALYELGASGGLNLLPDRYGIKLGKRSYGDPDSRVHIAPDWDGPDLPDKQPVVLSRRGVDLNPLDISDPEVRARLPAYVWPDQRARLERLDAALTIAANDPPAVTRGDAADWLDLLLSEKSDPGICRVIFHSIAFHYFPQETQDRIEAALAKAGAAAKDESPLAWLRLEMDGPEAGTAYLRLMLWPDGSDHLLAAGHPQGDWLRWLAEKPIGP